MLKVKHDLVHGTLSAATALLSYYQRFMLYLLRSTCYNLPACCWRTETVKPARSKAALVAATVEGRLAAARSCARSRALAAATFFSIDESMLAEAGNMSKMLVSVVVSPKVLVEPFVNSHLHDGDG